MIHSNSFMYFRYLKCFYTWYWTPQKPCINVYYFYVVKMQELFAIAVSFGFFVRNRGFSPNQIFVEPIRRVTFSELRVFTSSKKRSQIGVSRWLNSAPPRIIRRRRRRTLSRRLNRTTRTTIPLRIFFRRRLRSGRFIIVLRRIMEWLLRPMQRPRRRVPRCKNIRTKRRRRLWWRTRTTCAWCNHHRRKRQNNNNRYKRYVLDARASPRARGTNPKQHRTPPCARRVTAWKR